MMKQLLALVALALSCVPLAAQTTVTPIVQPHQTFVDDSGSPCASCKLYTYAAGTTTPQPTYTDSSGTVQNQNPIVLDIAGGANIWVSNTLAYKYVLIDSLGTTVWTVDNVKASGGGAVPCTTAFAIQYANSDHTALACDPTITIDPTSHSILVGGAISGPFFTLTALGTIPSSWTLDVTSPTTALNSFGAIPDSNLAAQNPDTVLMNATASTAAPAPVALPSGCSNGLNYSTTTHSWTCASTTVPLSNLAAQLPDTVIGNFTGSTAAPSATSMPTDCTNGVNYSTVTHAWTCATSAPTISCTGTTSPWSCYRTNLDGSLEEWGVVTSSGTGADQVYVGVSFPQAFPDTTRLWFEAFAGNCVANCLAGNKSPTTLSGTGQLTAFGNTLVLTGVVPTGGGGNTNNQNVDIHWHAIRY